MPHAEKTRAKGAAHEQEMERCIDECHKCAKSCHGSMSHCLELGGEHASAHHIGLLADCAAICEVTASVMAHGGPLMARTAQLCVEACRSCQESCEQFPDDATMRECAEACRRCAEACEAMVAA
jgi:hypothetical protein